MGEALRRAGNAAHSPAGSVPWAHALAALCLLGPAWQDQRLLPAWALSMADVEQLQPHKQVLLQWAVRSEHGVGLLLPQPADRKLLAGLGTAGASYGETLGC